MKPLRIVFMGTPEFASGILEAILQTPHQVVAVVTAPDRPAGRGQKLKFSAVKEFAVARDIPVLQPVSLKDESFLLELAAFEADVQVVVAFRMLPKAVWTMPAKGTFNLHASLLPDYRGAAPINWAIINGETRTGVTTFFIDEQIDTGAMILSRESDIADTDDVGTLHDRLMELGKSAVTDTLDLIASGTVSTTPQRENAAMKPAPKLTRENTRIDWAKPGRAIVDLVRGLSPYPAAWSMISDGVNEWQVKVYAAEFIASAQSQSVGKVSTSKKEIKVAVADGWISLLQIRLPGKAKMRTADLLNGMAFSPEAIAS